MCAHKLFPLSLEGQGTSEIESLPSYLFRSAFCHSTSVGILLRVIHEMDDRSELPVPRALSTCLSVRMLAQENVYTVALRKKISELTNQNISCQPLRFLYESIHGFNKQISSFRWCPECLFEMDRLGLPLYFKQIWHIDEFICCPIHGTPFHKACEYCYSSQNIFTGAASIGTCLNCLQPLFPRRNQVCQKWLEINFRRIEQDLISIFEKVSREPEIVGCKKKIRDVVESRYRLVLEEYESQKSVSRKKDIRLYENYLKNESGSYKLESLKTLSSLMNISLYELLIGDDTCQQGALELTHLCDLPILVKRKQNVYHNHKEEYRKLLKVLSRQREPPSLKRVARLAGLSVGYIEYRFPVLVRKVVDTRSSFLARQALVTRYRAQVAALTFFVDERYAPHTKSRKEAFRVLSAETGLPKWVLKKAIQVAYQALCVGG